jgi:hypothetical protein
MIEVGDVIAEAMHSEPRLGQILPLDEKVERCEKTFLTSKSFLRAVDSITYQTNGKVYGIMQPQTILSRASEDLRDELVEQKNSCSYGYQQLAGACTEVKSVCTSNFKIEEDHEFPICAQTFPNIIERIEVFLTCFEKFQFRASFSNVCLIRQREIEVQPISVIRMPLAEADFRLTIKERRKCICQTQMFKHLDKYKRYGSKMRIIYNNMMTFNIEQDRDAAIICSTLEDESTQCTADKV